MALTLLEYKKGIQDPLQAAVINEFAETSDLLRELPFDDIEGGGVTYLREDTLPGIAFRGINEGYTEDAGVLNPLSDNLTIAGGDIDVDKALVDLYGPSRRVIQERMKVKALALKWTKTFIKGDSTTTPAEYDGLQTRLINSQLVYAGATNATAGTALSLAKLDELIDQVDRPTHLLMNKTMRRLLSGAARNTSVGGYITYEPDAFGRRVMFYNDLPILIVDEDETGAQILGFSEGNATGTTGTNTSIYCIHAGDGYLTGIQGGVSSNGGMDKQFGIRVSDLGLQTDTDSNSQNKSVLRTRIEWYSGIAMYHSRAAARLAYLSNGAVTT